MTEPRESDDQTSDVTDLPTEVGKRRTFAIISHPDAGKTTLTEKLLLYGGAIHLAGAVKSRRANRHATSDWMELEKQRGISVTTSVMSFAWKDHVVNLLDTPGHQDFSEDTYRTLAAVDSAVMLVDVAKGVEQQTKKLFAVCRMRGIPIFTFVNKLDRHGRDPLEIMDEIEQVLGIRSCPVNWPIGMGTDFRGVYDRQKKRLHLFDASGRHGEVKVRAKEGGLEDPTIVEALGEAAHRKLLDDLEMLDIAGDPFDLDRVLAGELAPMYFGSAMTNFGVEPFLGSFIDIAPAPAPRATTEGPVDPTTPAFSGFVFKIQANMDPSHRDRLAFLRIVSGRFERGMTVKHLRMKRDIRLSKSHQFLAQERASVEEAYAGDVIGLYDPGLFRIGDTLSERAQAPYLDIPRFSPEHFVKVRVKDVLKRKQLKAGLDQLSEEGAIQVFHERGMGEQSPILGAVGALQFDVLLYRLKTEYGVDVILDPLGFTVCRWVTGDDVNPRDLDRGDSSVAVEDKTGALCALFRNEWAFQWAQSNTKGATFHDTAP